MNFMTCDVSAALTAHNVYIPFTNNDYANTFLTNDVLLAATPATPDLYTKKAGAGALFLFSDLVWDGAFRPNSLAEDSKVGWYVLFGASRYLNKMTGYASGFHETGVVTSNAVGASFLF